jgi:hypothetical protein
MCPAQMLGNAVPIGTLFSSGTSWRLFGVGRRSVGANHIITYTKFKKESELKPEHQNLKSARRAMDYINIEEPGARQAAPAVASAIG